MINKLLKIANTPGGWTSTSVYKTELDGIIRYILKGPDGVTEYRIDTNSTIYDGHTSTYLKHNKYPAPNTSEKPCDVSSLGVCYPESPGMGEGVIDLEDINEREVYNHLLYLYQELSKPGGHIPGSEYSNDEYDFDEDEDLPDASNEAILLESAERTRRLYISAKLVKIANMLDAKGEVDLANEVDTLIKIAVVGKTTYYLIEDDTWRIVPQTGIAPTEESGMRLWEHHEGRYSLVERVQSPTERSEKIIQPAGGLDPESGYEQPEDPPAWYEGED